jgi:hypothetical protein
MTIMMIMISLSVSDYRRCQEYESFGASDRHFFGQGHDPRKPSAATSAAGLFCGLGNSINHRIVPRPRPVTVTQAGTTAVVQRLMIASDKEPGSEAPADCLVLLLDEKAWRAAEAKL